ncbi:hypothetical protein COOONC_21569 [Cooperia oncophora]
MIRESSVPDSKKRDLILLKLEDSAHQVVRMQENVNPTTIRVYKLPSADFGHHTVSRMDNGQYGNKHDIHAVQKKKVKCFGCGGPHFKSACPLLKQISKKPKKAAPPS